MKKLFLLAFVAASAVGLMQSCKKTDSNSTPTYKTYTQKLVLEYFSGAWCGYCPDGRVYAEKLITKYGADKFYPVTVHYGDYLQNNDGAALNTELAVTGYPTGGINRVGGIISRNLWDAKCQAILDDATAKGGAPCGLAIDAKTGSGSSYTVKVSLGIPKTAMDAAAYTVVGYLIHKVENSPDGDPNKGQANYFYDATKYPGHPYNNRGTAYTTTSGTTVYIIVPYDHINVHMATYKAAVDAANIAAGKVSSYTFNVTLPYGDASEYHFIASCVRGGLNPQVMNTQKCDIGATKDFD